MRDDFPVRFMVLPKRIVCENVQLPLWSIHHSNYMHLLSIWRSSSSMKNSFKEATKAKSNFGNTKVWRHKPVWLDVQLSHKKPRSFITMPVNIPSKLNERERTCFWAGLLNYAPNVVDFHVPRLLLGTIDHNVVSPYMCGMEDGF